MGKPSAARERILETADRLFYNEGIHAVGIQRVIAESAVTKVTLYRHFPSKDDLIAAYLTRRGDFDRELISGIIAANPGDPRTSLQEIGVSITRDDFAVISRGCPFINASAEFTDSHLTRRHAREIRHWVTSRLQELLEELGHPSPRATSQQLMLVRTGAVVSAALDENPELAEDYLSAWNALIG